MTTHASHAAPVALPTVNVTIDESGTATVTPPGDPDQAPERVARDEVEAAVREFAVAWGPVRVQVTESDGSQFTDILLPASADSPAWMGSPASGDKPTRATPDSHSGVAGTGFLPGEHVDIAVILTNLRADAKGNVQLRLPPAALAGRAVEVVLLGRVSGLFNVCESS